ncbi:MAG: hypothetical protein PHD58_00650 [Anaerolineales bacterium]|nr:hypothetical protein [Anaerolineales bacterium]
MKFNLRAPISTVVAMAVGLIVLAGYFIQLPLLTSLRRIFLQWGVILAASALVVGVVNLLSVHWRKVSTQQKGGVYSAVLLVSFAITLVVAGYSGPTGGGTMWIFRYVQIPIESSLMAILAVALAYAIARLLRRRTDAFSIVFAITVLAALLGLAPILGVEIPGLHGPDGLRDLLARIPALAGARGILLGVALGAIATALRVLMGADRPYGG